jgi:hypothetical protein
MENKTFFRTCKEKLLTDGSSPSYIRADAYEEPHYGQQLRLTNERDYAWPAVCAERSRLEIYDPKHDTQINEGAA